MSMKKPSAKVYTKNSLEQSEFETIDIDINYISDRHANSYNKT